MDYLSEVTSLMVCGNRRQQRYLDDITRFLDMLVADGFRVTVESRLGAHLREQGVRLPAGCSESPWLPQHAGAVVSLGGDGTFLRVAHMVGDSGVPILGINTGHLGFLASYTLDDSREICHELRAGRVCVEPRAVLRVECPHLPPTEWPYALNEVAVLKEETSSMITVRAEVDGHWLADYLADGLVIATATGSTAYSLSAGGPILAPTLDNIVLTPLAPHSLTLRPTVLSGRSHIRLCVQSRSGRGRVALDGRSFRVEDGTELSVSQAPFCVNVIRRCDDDFAAVLRNKLHWGAR